MGKFPTLNLSLPTAVWNISRTSTGLLQGLHEMMLLKVLAQCLVHTAAPGILYPSPHLELVRTRATFQMRNKALCSLSWNLNFSHYRGPLGSSLVSPLFLGSGTPVASKKQRDGCLVKPENLLAISWEGASPSSLWPSSGPDTEYLYFCFSTYNFWPARLWRGGDLFISNDRVGIQ